jgi:glycosyltransferase involved in cell wall biosynthesis
MFSVVLVTYNREKQLFNALKSIERQTFLPREIILVNNGVKKYKLSDFNLKRLFKKKIQIINNKKNLFQSTARNNGSYIAKGKFLCFLDDDDTWEKNYLKKIRVKIKKDNCDLVITPIYRKKKIFKKTKNISLNHLFLLNPGVTGSNIAISKSKFLKLKGFDKNMEPSEDKDLAVKAILNHLKISYSNSKVFFSSHENPRLTTNFVKLANGKESFYKKYSCLMNFKQKINNLYKINLYKIKSGQFSKIFILANLFFLNKFFN